MATPLTSEFEAFVRLLSERGVRFVVIGGQAVIFHGRVRATLDLDLLVAPTRQNAARVAAAIAEFASPFAETYDFAVPGTGVRIGPDAGLHIDVTNCVDGIEDIKSVWRRSVQGSLLGVPVRFMGAEDMLATKRAANRPKDKADIGPLDRIQQGRPEPAPRKTADARPACPAFQRETARNSPCTRPGPP